MQGVLTSREAWTRFACAIYSTMDVKPSEAAAEADQMLIQYLRRFPDPPGQESAELYEEGVEFLAPDGLTDLADDAASSSEEADET